MTTLVHVTHEAVHQAGGIGAVLRVRREQAEELEELYEENRAE